MVRQLIGSGLAILLLVSLIFVCGCTSGKDVNSTANTSSLINNPYENVNISANNYIENNGLTSAQKADAINIIMNDSVVKELITRPNTSYAINDVSFVDADSNPWDMKDHNVSACIALVPMTFTVSTVANGSRDITAWNNINGLVDLNNNSCMELIVTDFRGNPEYGYVILPPESSWNILLTSWIPSYEINMTFEPAEAKIYPIVLDRTNFANYKNGTPYRIKENPHSGGYRYYNGKVLLSQNQTIFMNTQYNGAVLILKYDGAVESKINIDFG